MGIENKIHSLIRLLDDPDEAVYKKVRGEFFRMGSGAIPELEGSKYSEISNELFDRRVDELINELRLKSLSDQLKAWRNDPEPSLLTGMTLICNYRDPEITERDLAEPINDLVKRIWLELNDDLTGPEKVQVVNRFLFGEYGFDGDKEDYHAPENSYLCDVLTARKGNPISLSIVYLLVAEQLDLPIKGINLPYHFMIGYMNPLYLMGATGAARFLFYVNPFDRGALMGEEEVTDFLKTVLPRESEFKIEACATREMVMRVFTNLIHSYEKQEHHAKARELKKLQAAISE